MVNNLKSSHMNKLIVFIVFTINLIYELHATEYKGSATNASESLAKRNALIDLQHSIYIIVESSSSSLITSSGNSSFKQSSKVYSNIPLLGVSTECFKTAQEYTCFATLDAKTAVPKYTLAIESNVNAIKIRWNAIQHLTRSETLYSKLTELLPVFEETRRLNYVRTLLAGRIQEIIYPITPAEINARLNILEKDAMSLSLIALKLKESIGDKKIFVKPITPSGSIEVTPLSSELYYLIRKELNIASSKDSAEHFLTGEYKILDDKIYLEFHLTDSGTKVVKSALFRIHTSKLNGLEYRESAKLFEQELISNRMTSPNFDIKLKTNKGFRELLFKGGEFATFYVKANEPIQYFIVSHLYSENNNFSYLLELNDLEDKNRFVGSLSTKALGNWIEVFEGGFTVSNPYGMETLQVFAAKEIDLNAIPECSYRDGYCIIEKQGTEAIKSIRQRVRHSSLEATETFIQIKTVEL